MLIRFEPNLTNMWCLCTWICVLLHFLIRTGSESQKSVIKCDTRKTLLLLDGWMELNQTWAQCSPSGGAFGVCSVFGSGSGSGSDDKKCVGQRPYEVLSYRSVRLSSSVVHNWEKMLLLLDGWMDLNQTWTQCSPSGGASGLCSAFGSGSRIRILCVSQNWTFFYTF